MKIWNGYGSEHSANLVMIGHFESADDARSVIEKLNMLREGAEADDADESNPSLFEAKRFSDQMLELLTKIKIYSLGASELGQFLYAIDWQCDGDKVVITTEECDVSAFLKVFLDEGARVEVFSPDVHKGSGYGRGE